MNPIDFVRINLCTKKECQTVQTCITNSRRLGNPRSVMSMYSGSFSFFACCIWASRLIGFIPWPYSGLVCNLDRKSWHQLTTVKNNCNTAQSHYTLLRIMGVLFIIDFIETWIIWKRQANVLITLCLWQTST